MATQPSSLKKLERRVLVQNKYGIHVRPSTCFVQVAQRFKSIIKVRITAIEGQQMDMPEEYDGKSVLQLLQLGAMQGTELLLSSEGEDAEDALNSLEQLFLNKFGFEE
ncbi:MAG: HPr family phosphocarrier protein [Planctomycetota bacterium]